MKITAPNRWDRRFFDLVHLVGSWSEDNSRKIGAVIVGPSKEVRSVGFNGLPRKLSGEILSRHSKELGEKYYWFEHAERNAIYNAARIGVSLEGCEIYTSLFPCADCMRAVLQTGVSTLKTYLPPQKDDNYSRSFEVSFEMATEFGLNLQFYEHSAV